MNSQLRKRLELERNTILSGPYKQWLVQHGDEPLPDWVVRIIARELKKTPRVRHGSFASSEAGQCIRRQLISYMGMEAVSEHLGAEIEAAPDAQLQNVFNDGKWRHLRWQANLLAGGLVEDIEVPMRIAKYRSVSTLDAIGVVPDDHPVVKWRGKRFGVELKGVQMFQYNRYVTENTQMDKHKGQFMRYLLASGFDLFIVLYENKNFNDWHEWVVEAEQKGVTESRRELKLLNQHVDNKELAPMLPSCRARFGRAWDNCPYKGRNGICESMTGWAS